MRILLEGFCTICEVMYHLKVNQGKLNMYTKATSKITKQRIITNTSTYIYVERDRETERFNKPKRKREKRTDRTKRNKRQDDLFKPNHIVTTLNINLLKTPFKRQRCKIIFLKKGLTIFCLRNPKLNMTQIC